MRVVGSASEADFTTRLDGLLGGATGARGASAVVVHGASGVGQSDVVSELRQKVEQAGGLVLEGSCAAGPDGPFRPFQQIVRTLAQRGSDPLRAQADTLLAGALDDTGSRLRDVLARVRVRDGRTNHMESVRRILADAAAAGSTLVVLHDLHAADADTVALVHYLLAASASSGVIGLRAGAQARPTYVLTLCDETSAGRRLLEDLRSPDVESVAVQPLDAAGLARIVCEPAIADKLLRVTGGLPSAVRTLFEVLPDDIDALVDSRLQGLSPDAIGALRFARAFGEPIGLGALSVLAQVPRSTVEGLRRAGYLSDAEAGGREPFVTVAGAWQGSAVLAISDPAVLRAVHARCAEHLSARLAVGGGDALHEPIARHLLAAADVERAMEHAIRAATWLQGQSALERAIELLESALSAAGAHGGGAGPVTLKLVELDVAMGRYEDALGRCASLTPDGADGTTPLALNQARIHDLSGDLQAAERALDQVRAVDLPPSVQERRDCQLADLRLRRGDLTGAEELCVARLASDRFADSLTPLMLRNTLAKISFWRSEWDLAERRCQALLESLSREATSPAVDRLRSMVVHNLGLVALRMGRYELAASRIQEALGLIEALGDHFEAAVAQHNLGIANEYCQRYGMAIRLLEASIDVMQRFGNRPNLSGAVNTLGDLYLTIGETWRARKLLDLSLSIAQENGHDYFVAFNQLRLASVERTEGRLAEALALVDAAYTAFERSGHKEEQGEALLLRAELRLAGGDLAQALADLERAEDAGGDEVTGRAMVVRATALGARSPGKSHSMALRAADELKRLGQRDGVVQALTQAGVSARLGGQTAEARRVLTQAGEQLAELRARVPVEHHEAFDAMPWVKACRAALDEPKAPAAAPRRAARKAPVGRPNDKFHALLGKAPSMLRVFELIEKLGDCDAPILIIGESGTGKELVAEAISKESSRANKPLVRVNAAAFADTLLESELFGHEKGAFTGAVARKLGAFEQANGGTLFLDEIGDISPKTQVSLLRVLQEREIRRVGGRHPIRVDVRILCATNRNLEKMVEEGTFRLDLYYRVKGLTIELPPLRTRGEDIDLLANRFLVRLAERHGRPLTLADDARELLRRYRWPGNVRELENVLRAVYFFAQDDRITADDLTTYTLLREALPRDLRGSGRGGPEMDDDAPLEPGFDLNEAKKALERRCIEKALSQSGGNITKAATLLGMKRPRLSQKVKEYRVDR